MMFAVYHPNINFSFPGLSRFHPANLTKYRQALASLPRDVRVLRPKLDCCQNELAGVHDATYLKAAIAGNPQAYATATEVPQLRYAPAWLIRQALAKPMLAAVSLTIAASHLAWSQKETVFAIGGGFHHAKPAKGEGFCLFNDVAAAIHSLRQAPSPPSRIAYIDLDAHMGNGIAHCFLDDRAVKLFDLYMAHYYPASDNVASSRLDYGIALSGNDTAGYMRHLTDALPAWLDLVEPEIVFVNMGQDVLESDPLTSLRFSIDDVRHRDQAVASAIVRRKIPVVYVAGGGYTREAGEVLANSIVCVHQTYDAMLDRSVT